MYEFHTDKKRYFNVQKLVTAEHIIPFLENNGVNCSQKTILEIGCGEAGVLAAFLENANQCVGIELSPSRAKLASAFHKKSIEENKIRIISKNIHDIDIDADLEGMRFDIIVLKDVIEHIFEREEFMNAMHRFLNPDGVIFFAFPPWQMPFGGHQQICNSSLLKKLPYFHLLPKSIYKTILKSFNESDAAIKELLEIKETQISIGQFHQLCKKTGYKILVKQHYFINPIYKHKFGLEPKKQIGFISTIPYLRNFVTTGVYYVIKPN